MNIGQSLWWVMQMSFLLGHCVEGDYICVRDNPPAVQYYKKGESCYINGEFYESCPGIVQESKERKRKPWD